MSDFRFSTSIAVRYADLDAQGHLNHAKYFTYMEQARFEYILAVGLWRREQGFEAVGQIVAEAACSYKRPVQLGESVTVGVRTSRLGTKSMELEYRLSVGPAEVAVGRTVQVAYDYTRQASVALPLAWRTQITAFEGSAV